MDLAQARLQKNANDAEALYSLGVSNGLKSNYDFLVRKAWKDALGEATAARKLHSRVTELDPSNYDARLTQGVHEYLVGSLSWLYRSLGFLAGFHGDKALGIRTLEEVAHKGRYNRVDAEVLLCVLYRREEQPRKALALLAELTKRYPRNYLFKFEQAQMYSGVGDKNAALATLDNIAELKRAQSPGYANIAWEKIYYEKGNVQFWYNDLGAALENLKKATVSTKDLDLNTGVLAFMRQGQIYDMTNRHSLAVEAYRKAIAFGAGSRGGEGEPAVYQFALPGVGEGPLVHRVVAVSCLDDQAFLIDRDLDGAEAARAFGLVGGIAQVVLGAQFLFNAAKDLVDR